MSAQHRTIIGIDEVGRGPLAGPVTLCAVAAPAGFEEHLAGIRDSKKLSPKAREAWVARMEGQRAAGTIRVALVHTDASIIDSRGISAVISAAVAQTLVELEVSPAEAHVMLDGSLKAPAEFSQEVVIRGDEKVPLIALASIFAKVARDALMEEAAKTHVGYGFDVHKGYGTAAHIAAIRALGLSPIHRRSFCRNILSAPHVVA